MRRLITALVLALIASACSGGTADTTTTTEGTTAPTTTTTTVAPTTTEPPAATFTSDDGRVTIEVPSAALPGGDPGITITAMADDDQHPELGELEVKPWLYRLEPEKLEFDAPVTLSMTVPFDEFVSEGFAGATPLATLVTTTLDGSGWELLDDLAVRRDGDLVTMSGTTTHFSRVAAVPEQVFIETRFLEITSGPEYRFGVDFTWSNGVPLLAPQDVHASWVAETLSDPVAVSAANDAFSIVCPPDVTGLPGDFRLEMLLQATSDVSGQTGLTQTPKLVTTDGANVRFDAGLRLLCRPTISTDGTITMGVEMDHPDGREIVPGGNFNGGFSAEQVTLDGEFPNLYGGLIHDTNSNGVIDIDDLLYPPFLGSVTGGTTVFVLPLFGYGDYFNYFVDVPSGAMPAIETAVTVQDGATIILGGLIQPEQTAVPFLGDVPFIGRVFSEETSTTEQTELVIFITPRIVQADD